MIGKLTTPDLKKNVLDIIKRRRSEVITPAAVGEDCAVLKLDDLLLVTSDPITGAGKNVGSLAVTICANDVAASGGEAVAALLTVIAPERASLDEIREVMRDAERTAAALRIEIAGGHTEYSDAVNRTIVSCTMLGVPFVHGRTFTSTALKPGDSVLLTHSAAQEYTAIMACDKPELLQGALSEAELAEARQLIDKLSIVPEARLCSALTGVSAMHDVTEGGIEGALGELLDVTGLGANIQTAAIPVLSVTRKICKACNVRPTQVLSSGNLLIVTDRPTEALEALAKAGIEANRIGVVSKRSGLRFV